MAKTEAATTKTVAKNYDPLVLAFIGELAVEAHRAHLEWSAGRSAGISYRGAGGLRDLAARKGEAERRLREHIEAAYGDCVAPPPTPAPAPAPTTPTPPTGEPLSSSTGHASSGLLSSNHGHTVRR